MPAQQQTNYLKVFVGGSPIPDTALSSLVAAFVDDSLSAPDMFQISFRDANRTLLEETGIAIGKTITIKVFSDDFPSGEKLLDGEVTSLEAEYDPGGTMTTVRGYDKSHRLFRGRMTASYLNASYSDVAKKVAQRAGLEIGKVDSSSPVHEHVTQGNVSDWVFLKTLAGEIGYEVGCVDGKFIFRKPLQSASGPTTGNLKTENPLQLTLGQNLIRFRTVVSAAEQVGEVQVRSWDIKKKEAAIGSKAAGTASVAIGATPGDLASKFGNKKYVSVHTPFHTQSEAQVAAEALSDQIGGAFTEMEGVARGNPKLRAGTVVSLGLVNPPFDGKYVLTSTRHMYDPKDGYTVWFTVSGRQDRSLLGTVNGAAGGASGGTTPPIPGVVIGIVTNNNDPDKLGRIKVKFPWLDDKYESPWARIAFHGAGPDRGTVILPEVNDEVLVAFEHGDTRRPYVIGGLYNGKDKPMLGNGLVSGAGEVTRRGFVSRAGHKMVYFDDKAKTGVAVMTADKGFRISLNGTKKTIRIISAGKVEIDATQDVTVNAKANVNISAKANVKIDAAASMELKANASMKIQASGPLELKGAVIKLN